MPSLCNSTLCSCPDRDANQYWSSFCEKPFSCGDRFQVYKGKLNGKGPRAGDYSVVKVFIDHPGTEARCQQELKKASTGSEWLARFLMQGQYSAMKVKVAQLVMAPVDQVSLLNKVLAHNKRRICSGEWILLEEMLHERGDLTPFVDKRGQMYRERAASGSNIGLTYLSSTRSGSQEGHCSLENRELLDAFVHFTHHASNGQLVVCGLEGVENEKGKVTLKTPTVHSKRKEFGETDEGPQGVRQVMNRHVCNRHCRRWMRVVRTAQASSSIRSPSRSSSSSSLPTASVLSSSAPAANFTFPDTPATFPRQRHSPSAPYDPQVTFTLGPNPQLIPEPSAPPYEEVEESMELEELARLDEVFHSLAPHCNSLQDLRMFLRMELLAAKAEIPNEPPPPYSEF